MPLKKPILVTGSPRSGTTWVGRMIAQASSVHYIHEPFNISGLPCRCGVHFDYWFHYISDQNESIFYDHINHILYPKFNRIAIENLILAMWRTKRVRPLFNYVASLFKHRPLLKDPLALFSAPWLANTFDMNVVIVIRHPAAVVNSYKKLNWSHPFSHFLKQPALMEEQLADLADEIFDFAHHQYDLIDQASLLWKVLHHTILKYRQTQPQWIFVRQMDLARDPINGFQTIYEQLDLPFSDQVKQTIYNYSTPILIPESRTPYSINRSSDQTIRSWRSALTKEEIARIRKRVEKVSQAFFEDEDW